MESLLRDKKTIAFFILPALLIYLFIVFVPIMNSAYYSFFKWNIIGIKKFIGADNFIRIFTQDKIFLRSIGNTFYMLAASLLIQIPVGFLLALSIMNTRRGKKVYKTLLFMPNVIASVAIGLMWSFIYNPDFGLINEILRTVGLDSWTRPWLGTEATALNSVIFVICWQYVGYHMVLFLSGLESIPNEILEASSIDGASSFQRLRMIILPIMRPIIRIDAILIATSSLRYFDLIYVMTLGGPNHSSEVIASHLFFRTFRGLQFGYGSAISVILLVMSLTIAGIFGKLLHAEVIEY